jgi:hypothetical protein
MLKNTARLAFLLLLLSGVIPAMSPAKPLPPPTLHCTGTCNNGRPFECTGAGATCTDGQGCTVSDGGMTVTVSCGAS